MSDLADAEERELRMDLMRAQIANNRADANLKDEQRRWEPWKALSAAFGAGVAVASAMIAATAWILSHFIGHGS